MLRAVLLFFPLLILGLLTSCKTDPDSILGRDMHPLDDLVSKYDTAFSIEAFSVSDDSLILQNASTVLLGTSFSPVFGSQTYNLAVQILTMHSKDDDSYTYYSGSDLNQDSRVDSVVLTLPYSGVFPKHNQMDGRMLRFGIHEITEELIDGKGYDSAYCSNREPEHNTAPIGGMLTVYPRPFDTVYDSVQGAKTVPDLRVHLDKSFGKRLLDIVVNMSEEERKDLGAMRKYLKGLYLKMEPCATESQSIVFSVSNIFSLGADLTVYFNGSESTGTSYQKFVLGPLRYTHVKRDRSLSTDELYKAQMQNAGDVASGAQRLYVEGSGGSRIRFRIPDFQKTVHGKVVVNQAVIVLENPNAHLSPSVSAPKQLQCIRYYHRGLESDIPDVSNPGGTYNASKGQYRINITRYLQRLAYLTTIDTANRKLFNDYLDIVPIADERYKQPTRAVFYGPKSSTKKMRLEVVYTVVNDTIKK